MELGTKFKWDFFSVIFKHCATRDDATFVFPQRKLHEISSKWLSDGFGPLWDDFFSLHKGLRRLESVQKEIDSFIFRNPFSYFCFWSVATAAARRVLDSENSNSESSRESHYFPLRRSVCIIMLCEASKRRRRRSSEKNRNSLHFFCYWKDSSVLP